MTPDAVSLLLRAAAFVAVLQAVGASCFLFWFGGRLELSLTRITRLAQGSSLIAIPLVCAQAFFESARMAGDFAGLLDPTLHAIAFGSNNGRMIGLRIGGLLLIAIAARKRHSWGVVGVLLVAISFTLVGHTAVHAQRWLLAPLLALHVGIAGFWFGSIAALYVASRYERPSQLGDLVSAFSRVATLLVPVILIAGAVMAVILVPEWRVLREPYGLLLLTKTASFAMLMLLAALNKWRLGPALATDDRSAGRRFRAVLGAEALLIVAALAATATLTAFYSPEP